MDCLNNIIGLSQTECQCLEGQPDGYNESASGIFLDELDGFNIEHIRGADDCARGGYWDRMERAVTNAKTDFKSNLLACIGTTYKPRIDPLNVQLGAPNFTGSLNLNTNYAGVKLRSMQIKAGYMLINRIGILVNNSVPVTVVVYSNVNGGTLIYQSSPIAATANTLTWAAPATPIELPMFSYQTDIKYYVMLALDGTFQPKENKKDCGCGGVQRPYLKYMDFEGIKGNDITNIENTFNSTGNVCNGVVLDLSLKCKASEIICSSERPLDFEDDSDSQGMAFAIRFRAACILYEEVLSSTNLSRTTLVDREQMAANVARWTEDYKNWINYLCGNVNYEANGCYVCKDLATTLHKGYIAATR